MPSRIRVNGDHGVIRWGYKRAADVHAWRYVDGVLTAELINVHPLAITQTPLVFIVSGAGWRPDLGKLAARFPEWHQSEFRRELVGVTVQLNGQPGAARLVAQFAPRG